MKTEKKREEKEESTFFLEALWALAKDAPHDWQAILARRIGVSPEYVNCVFRGQRTPVRSMEIAIARYFGFSIGEILKLGREIDKQKRSEEVMKLALEDLREKYDQLLKKNATLQEEIKNLKKKEDQ